MGDRLNPPADGRTDHRSRAEEAWQLVATEVRTARALALEVIDASDDTAARSVALRTLGLCAIELGAADESLEWMSRGLAAARQTRDSELLAQAEMGVAVAHQYLGRRGEALRLAARAEQRAPSDPRIALSRGLILERFGDPDAANEAFGRAIALAAEQGNQQALLKAYSNRAIVRAYQADLDGADSDLNAAEVVATTHGYGHAQMMIAANQAFVAARRGEVVIALGRYDELSDEVGTLGGFRQGSHELDRCEVLLAAGLAGDAVATGQAAVEAFASAGAVLEVAEARTLVAQAALVDQDLEVAEAEATRARREFQRHSPDNPWRSLAEDVAVRTAWASGRRTPALASRAATVATALDKAGWSTSAASARVLAARIELQLGRRERAAEQLRLVRDTPRSPVGLRIQARAATALLRREAGDRRGARAALRSAWELLERHRATLGATELRAGATAHVAEIVSIAMEMAIEDRRPREVLRWAERGRVGALTPRATAPPEDSELARLLGELRVVAAEADAAAKRGDDSRALLRRQAQIEERVRGRARLLPPEAGGGAAPEIDPADILAAVGHRALLEYVVSGDDLWVVVGTRGRFTLRRACTVAQIADEADGLRVALRRLAFGSPVPQLRAAARQGADYARGRLRQLLFDPVADLVGERRRIIVPMGALHAVPWSALHEPDEHYVVAPSAALWARAAATPPRRGSALLVAGPRLAEAGAEVSAIATVLATTSLVAGQGDGSPTADAAHAPTVLTGDDATVDAVRDAMGGAALAHLACHGRFRADNPLFSSLELHDGALSVFELERLGRAPARIILSACDAGLSAVHPGDELLGLAAALLRLGTTGIVASVLPVPDAATRRLMEALHLHLAAGDTGLADALAAARAGLDPERDDDLVASWAFQVLGAELSDERHLTRGINRRSRRSVWVPVGWGHRPPAPVPERRGLQDAGVSSPRRSHPAGAT
ncbi:MAG: CHAT domain-containing protein [Solirubrobacteraceae bacterium]|nr:CHAT domain-containing protein [Solirubrobacteraceae bacterium]